MSFFGFFRGTYKVLAEGTRATASGLKALDRGLNKFGAHLEKHNEKMVALQPIKNWKHDMCMSSLYADRLKIGLDAKATKSYNLLCRVSSLYNNVEQLLTEILYQDDVALAFVHSSKNIEWLEQFKPLYYSGSSSSDEAKDLKENEVEEQQNALKFYELMSSENDDEEITFPAPFYFFGQNSFEAAINWIDSKEKKIEELRAHLL